MDIKETSKKKSNRIYTKLKFIKSEHDRPIAFVRIDSTTGFVYGISKDDPSPKMICVVGRQIEDQISTGILYNCTLIRIKGHGGYICIDAAPAKFKATIESNYIKGLFYTVSVKFGNQKLVFDPFEGRKESMKSLQSFISMLEKRVDVQNLEKVVSDFRKAADNILTLLYHDKYAHKVR